MITKIEASKLISLLIAPEFKKQPLFILTDNNIFQHILNTRWKLQSFSGKDGIDECINSLANSSMLAPVKSALVNLPEQFSAKIWTQKYKILTRIPKDFSEGIYFLGSTQLRNIVVTDRFPVYVCFNPQDIEINKCIFAIFKQYPVLNKQNVRAKEELARSLLDSYGDDLIAIDMHCARMDRAKLSFNAALVDIPAINSFQVLDALAQGDQSLISLRLNQCALAGEAINVIFFNIVSFMKQLAYVQAAFTLSKNFKLAFSHANIPFPAQARMQKAMQKLRITHIHKFFTQAAQIELDLRLQKNPHQYLAIELSALFDSD